MESKAEETLVRPPQGELLPRGEWRSVSEGLHHHGDAPDAAGLSRARNPAPKTLRSKPCAPNPAPKTGRPDPCAAPQLTAGRRGAQGTRSRN
jgi:hypothetical protein